MTITTFHYCDDDTGNSDNGDNDYV